MFLLAISMVLVVLEHEVVGRIGVADQRQTTLAVGDRRRGADDVLRAVGLAAKTTESTPGVDGPKVSVQLLSLMAKCWA